MVRTVCAFDIGSEIKTTKKKITILQFIKLPLRKKE